MTLHSSAAELEYYDKRPIDWKYIAALADCCPPVLFTWLQEITGWVPTISFTVYFLRKPQQGK